MVVPKGYPSSTSGLLGEFVVSASLEQLKPDVRMLAKLAIVDWLGVTIAGSQHDQTRRIIALVEQWGANGISHIVGTSIKTSPTWAAFANGASSHVLELDDLHRASMFHPAAPIVSAAIAAAEAEGCSIDELILAVIVGYDVGIRIAEAAGAYHYRHWHTTGTCGTFGAAAAVGKLLGLDHIGIVNALGSAGTQAAGLWQFSEDGAMSKPLHTARAAQNGLLSAYLAARGFTGAQRILEGKKGFFQTMAESANVTSVTDGLGTTFRILETDFKLHACCGHTHTALDLASEMSREYNFTGADIANVELYTYDDAMRVAGYSEPGSSFQAKFSLRYCTALGLLRQQALHEDFDERSLQDPEVKALMRRIRVVPDATLSARYPTEWPARLWVETTNGQIYCAEASYPVGSHKKPVDQIVLMNKFVKSLKGAVGESTALKFSAKVSMLTGDQRVSDLVDVMIP